MEPIEMATAFFSSPVGQALLGTIEKMALSAAEQAASKLMAKLPDQIAALETSIVDRMKASIEPKQAADISGAGHISLGALRKMSTMKSEDIDKALGV